MAVFWIHYICDLAFWLRSFVWCLSLKRTLQGRLGCFAGEAENGWRGRNPHIKVASNQKVVLSVFCSALVGWVYSTIVSHVHSHDSQCGGMVRLLDSCSG